MAFRGGNRNRSFGGGYGGGMSGGNRGGMNPWENQGGGGGYGSSMRQGGGGGGGPMNAEALNLANNLLNNLLRNQNPPSLLDLPRGGAMNRGPRGAQGNRSGSGAMNRNNANRRTGGFVRGGQKPGVQKQAGAGIRKQNTFDRAKKLLAKNSNNKKKDSASGDNANSKQKESISPYADVPNDMFYCHLCKKHMWDANSFENHIKGRTHLMMREGIEESYRLKANMIRQEAKIAEQLKSIELDRLKRMGKSGKRNMLEYCTMCDLSFHGHLSAHRKSDGHLTLKKFLHPKCSECNKEFPTRIEYDTHLLAPDHLKKAAEKNTKVGERQKNTLTILTEEDELKDVRPPQKKKKKVVKKEATVAAEGDAAAVEGEEKKENGEAGEGEAADSSVVKEDEEGDETKEGEEEHKEGDEYEEVPLPVDPEDVILDYTDGEEVPTEVEAKLPKYNWTRAVGGQLISKLECIECCICGKFFDNEKTAEVHSRTVSHHRNFLKFINDKSSDTKIAQKRAAAALEEIERKRKRLEEAEKAAAVPADGEAAVDGEGTTELYDPSEATGDDEANEEAQENGDANEDEKPETDGPVAKKTKVEEAAAEPEPEKEVSAPVPTTPVAAAATPNAKKTPAAKAATATPKATPGRGKGRGRYNRY